TSAPPDWSGVTATCVVPSITLRFVFFPLPDEVSVVTVLAVPPPFTPNAFRAAEGTGPAVVMSASWSRLTRFCPTGSTVAVDLYETSLRAAWTSDAWLGAVAHASVRHTAVVSRMTRHQR